MKTILFLTKNKLLTWNSLINVFPEGVTLKLFFFFFHAEGHNFLVEKTVAIIIPSCTLVWWTEGDECRGRDKFHSSHAVTGMAGDMRVMQEFTDMLL